VAVRLRLEDSFLFYKKLFLGVYLYEKHQPVKNLALKLIRQVVMAKQVKV
jgi:hypothetical protein